MLKFFISYFCLEKGKEEMFGDVLDRKQASPDYKNISVV